MSTDPSVSFLSTGSLASVVVNEGEVGMRSIGLDVHRDFCEVAIVAEGAVGSAGQIETTPAALELFAASPGAD